LVPSNTSKQPVDPVPALPAVDDAYLSMDVTQLRRKVKDLIGLKNKNRKTIDNLKKRTGRSSKREDSM